MPNNRAQSLSDALDQFRGEFEKYRDTGAEIAPLAMGKILDLLRIYAGLARTLEQNGTDVTIREARACAIDMERYVADLQRGRPKPRPNQIEPTREEDEALVGALMTGKVALHPRYLYTDDDVGNSQGGDAA